MGLTACGPEWSTSYSGKYEDSNSITVNLNHNGELTAGMGGPAPALLEAYSFELKPIRRVYTDDEITLFQEVANRRSTMRKYPEGCPQLKAKGTVSFDEDYSHVIIEINILKDGALTPFPGNGKYRVNAGGS